MDGRLGEERRISLGSGHPLQLNAIDLRTSALRPLKRTAYDKNGNVIAVTDPRGVVTRTVFDSLNRARFVTANADHAAGDEAWVTTETRYDPNGNVLALVLHNRVDSNGDDILDQHRAQVTTYEFDAFDRRTSETLPDIDDNEPRQTLTAYNRAGEVITITDPKGQSIESDYDRAGRVKQVRFKSAGGSLQEQRDSTYDHAGNLTKRTDRHGFTRYTYDALNRLAEEHRDTDIDGLPDDEYTVHSWYDAAGNRTRVIYPDTDRTLVSRFDRANRMTELYDGELISSFGYDSAGNRTGYTSPTGVVTSYTFDELNRVVSITARPEYGAGPFVYHILYDYDLAGNRRSANSETPTDHGQQLTWDYDDLYRLTNETRVSFGGNLDRTDTYVYDPAGNRLKQTLDATASGDPVSITTYEYDDRNRLLESVLDDGIVGTGNTLSDYHYDENGNLIEKNVHAPGTDDTTSYHYDVANRLISADTDSGGVGAFKAYYDARTRRIAKIENDGTDSIETLFRYDGGTNVQELHQNTGWQVTQELIRAGGLGGGIGSVLYSDKTMAATPGDWSTFVYDAVGNSTGTPTQRNLYEAFGETVIKDGDSDNNRLRNTKERDSTINLDNDGFRYYDPAVGRYIQRDPIGYGDGMNVYAHLTNNPINKIDPLGLSAEDEFFENEPTGIGWGLWQIWKMIDAGRQAVESGLTSAMTISTNVQNARESLGSRIYAGSDPKRYERGRATAPGDFAATTTDLANVLPLVPGMSLTGPAAMPTMTGLQAGVAAINAEERVASRLIIGGAGTEAAEGKVAQQEGISAERNIVPNPDGKKGGAKHQAGVAAVEADVESRGLQAQTEYKVQTPGGEKQSRYVDVAGVDPTNNEVKEFHQVGQQIQGGQPVARERRAIQDIDSATGIQPEFHPYNDKKKD